MNRLKFHRLLNVYGPRNRVGGNHLAKRLLIESVNLIVASLIEHSCGGY